MKMMLRKKLNRKEKIKESGSKIYLNGCNMFSVKPLEKILYFIELFKLYKTIYSFHLFAINLLF